MKTMMMLMLMVRFMLMLMIRLILMLMMMSRLAATTLAPDNISHQRHTHPFDAPHYDPAFPSNSKAAIKKLQDLPKQSFPINCLNLSQVSHASPVAFISDETTILWVKIFTSSPFLLLFPT